MSFVFSQEISIKGKITDNQNRSIESASVSVLSDDKETITYAFSDEKGSFNISLNPSGNKFLFLKVSSLDFEPKEIKINSESVILDKIVLNEKIENIDEILIIGKKIKIDQDTTTIKVDAFMSKTEQTVEDVLKKIPGIEVLKDGTIKAHGKTIDKLLIEGEDMFDKNYKLLSKNLDSKVLNEVQIIDNFEDNPIFKKLNNSDKVALNLKLKKGLKNIWFGNATLGSGVLSENRWKESLNLGLLKKKIKLFYFGDYNNLGEKSTDLITSNILDRTTFSNDRFEYKAKNSFNINTNDIQFFSKTQSTFNNAFLNSLSFNSKIKKNLSLRGVIYIANDKQFQNSFSKTTYNLENGPFSITEDNLYKSKKTLASTELELKYHPNDKNYITNLFILKNNPNKTSNELIFNDHIINQNIDAKNFTLYNHFNHTYQVSANKVLNNYFYFGKDNIQEKANIESPFLNSLFNIDNNSIINQNTNSQILYLGYKAKLISKFKKIDLTNSLQADYSKEFFNSKLLTSETLITDYQNKTQLKQIKISSDNTLRYNFSQKIDITANINFQNVNFDNNNVIENAFLINPSIDFNIKKTRFGNFSLSYSESSTLPEINQLTNQYQLIDYRTFQRGAPFQKLLKNNSASLIYSLYNDEKRYSINANIFYIKSKSIINTISTLTNDFIFNTLLLSNGGESYNFNFSFVNYIRKLKLASKIETNNSWNKTPINVNSNQFSISENFISSLKYSATTYFKFPANFDFGFSYNFFKSGYQEIKTINNTKDAFMNINYKLSKTILLESNNSFYFVNHQNYSFNNVILNYTPLESRFSYRLIFNNIFNENQYTYISLSNYISNQSTIKLVPRYLLTSLKYRF